MGSYDKLIILQHYQKHILNRSTLYTYILHCMASSVNCFIIKKMCSLVFQDKILFNYPQLRIRALSVVSFLILFHKSCWLHWILINAYILPFVCIIVAYMYYLMYHFPTSHAHIYFNISALILSYPEAFTSFFFFNLPIVYFLITCQLIDINILCSYTFLFCSIQSTYTICYWPDWSSGLHFLPYLRYKQF